MSTQSENNSAISYQEETNKFDEIPEQILNEQNKELQRKVIKFHLPFNIL
jgi:hypothetical protein